MDVERLGKRGRLLPWMYGGWENEGEHYNVGREARMERDAIIKKWRYGGRERYGNYYNVGGEDG